MPVLVPPVVPAGRLRNQAQPTLRAGDLTLRPWRLSDADAVLAAYRDPGIQRWHARSIAHDEVIPWLSSWSDRWRAETGAGWAVTEQDTLVGRVGFGSIDLDEGMAEIAYWTVPAARGRNIAARAVLAASGWMFRAVGLHRLELSHSTLNPASCRIAEKAGYPYEGTRRQQVLHQDGWHDMHLHARLATDETPADGLPAHRPARPGWAVRSSPATVHRRAQPDDARQGQQRRSVSAGTGSTPWIEAITRPNSPSTPSRGAHGRLARETPTGWSASDPFADMLHSEAASDRAIIEAVATMAKARGVSRAQVALAWLRHYPVVVAPIVGVSKPSHLADAVASLDIELPEDETAALEAPYTPRYDFQGVSDEAELARISARLGIAPDPS